MKKAEFFKTLKTIIPIDEAREILNDFEEHFATGLSQGKTEEQIVQELGDPVEIAKEYGYEENNKEVITVKPSVGSRVVYAIGLIFFDLIIGIALFATVFAIWILLWAVVLSLLVSSVALILGSFFIAIASIIPWYFSIITGIALLGLTGLLTVAMVYLSKYYFLGILWYGKLHVKVITGE